MVWDKVDVLIKTTRPSNYDEAVRLLVDLRDLSNKKSGIGWLIGEANENWTQRPLSVRQRQEI